MSNPGPIPVCMHFRNEGRNCIQHAKFTLVEQLTETENVSKVILKFRLKQKENSWILKVGTLVPQGLCQELIMFNVQQLLLQIKFYYSTAARKEHMEKKNSRHFR